jgi:transcriptional regulator with XRE-family HTH domain
MRVSMGKRIEGARLAAGFTKASDFAKACGVSKQYLHNLEHGKVEKPDPANLILLAKVLNVSVEWLITGAGDPARSLGRTENERDLLRCFRMLDPEQQTIILHTVHRFADRRR